ncbi:hypothetical protein IPM09_02265 [Candidatus Saccharibacteria bacterium]|nr:MAG: hypothetical protein IPM09_02265 [Candidatus Saccharibacteria bacterium]
MKANRNIPTIHLSGYPYQQEITDGLGYKEEIDCSSSLNKLAQSADYFSRLDKRVKAVKSYELAPLYEAGFYGIDAKLKHGGELTFEEAYSLIAFVVMSLNRAVRSSILEYAPVPAYPLWIPSSTTRRSDVRETQLMQATSLLSGMSSKEGYVGLLPEEIAGVVAATVDLDTVVRTESQRPVIALGGMGGDKGYGRTGKTSKLFSLSTLSSAILAVDGATHKHHSYPNTSKVAGQSAVEALGARSDFHNPEAFQKLLDEVGLMMSSCHNTRTLHTLSHRLKGETINHIIGPLAYTLTPETVANGFIGVNEKIHPATVISALEILSKRKFQTYDNSVAFFGTDREVAHPDMFDPKSYYHSPEARESVAIDEVAPPPYATVAAFMRGGELAGTFEIRPTDFFTEGQLSVMTMHGLMVPNEVDAILAANRDALAGRDEAKAMYLAMTAGLGIFTRKYLDRVDALHADTRRVNADYLRAATREALEIIHTGAATAKMKEYVTATNNVAGG